MSLRKVGKSRPGLAPIPPRPSAPLAGVYVCHASTSAGSLNQELVIQSRVSSCMNVKRPPVFIWKPVIAAAHGTARALYVIVRERPLAKFLAFHLDLMPPRVVFPVQPKGPWGPPGSEAILPFLCPSTDFRRLKWQRGYSFHRVVNRRPG